MTPTTAAPTFNTRTQTWTARLPDGRHVAHARRAVVEANYLRAIAPTIARQVEHCARTFPALASRALQAGLLVAAQAVQPIDPTAPNTLVGEFARVRGSGDSARANGAVLTRALYSVTVSTAGYACECPDWTDGHAPFVPALASRLCKHILAALLAQ